MFEIQQENMMLDDYNEVMFEDYVRSLVNNANYVLEEMTCNDGYSSILDFDNEEDFIAYLKQL